MTSQGTHLPCLPGPGSELGEEVAPLRPSHGEGQRKELPFRDQESHARTPVYFFLLICCPHVFLHRFYVFFFFNLFIFNGRIIALQYWVGFCHTSTWISHRYTYVRSLLSLPPSPSHLSRLLQSPGFTLWKTDSQWEFAVDSILMAPWLISVVQTQLPRSCPQKRLQAGLQSSCSVYTNSSPPLLSIPRCSQTSGPHPALRLLSA